MDRVERIGEGAEAEVEQSKAHGQSKWGAGGQSGAGVRRRAE